MKLFSGLALNNASGGINPHAVNHAIKYRRQDRVDADAVGREPHRASSRAQAKTFPKTAKKMLDPIPLTALDANGKLSDDTKQCST